MGIEDFLPLSVVRVFHNGEQAKLITDVRHYYWSSLRLGSGLGLKKRHLSNLLLKDSIDRRLQYHSGFLRKILSLKMEDALDIASSAYRFDPI